MKSNFAKGLRKTNYFEIMAYKIPLFNLNFDEREAKAAYDTIKSGWISTGPKNEQLEQMFVPVRFGVELHAEHVEVFGAESFESSVV